VDLLVGGGISFKRSNKSIVSVKGTDAVEVGVVLNMVNITPTSSDGFLKVLNSFLEIVAKEGFNTCKVIERSDAMERTSSCLLLEEFSSLLQTFASLSLH